MPHGERARAERDGPDPRQQGRPLGATPISSAWAQAREQARLMREQARQAREHVRGLPLEEALGHAQRLREGAASFRDDLMRGAAQAGGGHGASWPGWADWSHWADWPGRKGFSPHDMSAFLSLERLAREFVGDLRKVAWESGALGGDVLGNLREILDETLDRIKAEVRDATEHDHRHRDH